MANDHRNRPTGKNKEQQALLDELDSLKSLLKKDKEHEQAAASDKPWEFVPPAPRPANPAVPDLDEVVDVLPPEKGDSAPPGRTKLQIPTLDEVVRAGNRRGDVPELTNEPDTAGKLSSTPPTGEALHNLIDLLVERRLQRLKPMVTSQIISELERLYPSLKKR